MLAEGPSDVINGKFDAAEAKTKFYLTLHYNRDNSYLIVNAK